MSRHRRQPSQAIPPEIFSGEDIFTKPFDLSQAIITEEDSSTSTTTSTTTRSTISEQKTKAPTTVTTSPVKPKVAPVQKSA
ncbi:hypothetical protein TSUD_251820 [Trifolium subterraneum]|uniref:Uncharacterized protein n=1 Tax=Trifolium subterraneum TaxID=3900 RepID=A0A2Z6LS88_TRISU|nr:hypothetical protein TSUD_251820 [Trifolium subterraneum]